MTEYEPTWPKTRKARIGWWVEGQWCPTVAVRDHRLAKLRASTLGSLWRMEASLRAENAERIRNLRAPR